MQGTNKNGFRKLIYCSDHAEILFEEQGDCWLYRLD